MSVLEESVLLVSVKRELTVFASLRLRYEIISTSTNNLTQKGYLSVTTKAPSVQRVRNRNNFKFFFFFFFFFFFSVLRQTIKDKFRGGKQSGL